MRILHYPLLIFGLAGGLAAWIPRYQKPLNKMGLSALQLVTLILAFFTLLHMVGFPLPRYATPFRPLLFGLAMTPVFLYFTLRSQRAQAAIKEEDRKKQGRKKR